MELTTYLIIYVIGIPVVGGVAWGAYYGKEFDFKQIQVSALAGILWPFTLLLFLGTWFGMIIAKKGKDKK